MTIQKEQVNVYAMTLGYTPMGIAPNNDVYCGECCNKMLNNPDNDVELKIEAVLEGIHYCEECSSKIIGSYEEDEA